MEVLPKMGAARDRTNYICDIVVAQDSPISAEIELLPRAVCMHFRGKGNVNPYWNSAAKEYAVQTRCTKGERQDVVVPKCIPEEVESVQRGPAAQPVQPFEGPAVVSTFQAATPVGMLNGHISIGESATTSLMRISAEDCDAFVWEDRVFLRWRKRALKSFEGEQWP